MSWNFVNSVNTLISMFCGVRFFILDSSSNSPKCCPTRIPQKSADRRVLLTFDAFLQTCSKLQLTSPETFANKSKNRKQQTYLSHRFVLLWSTNFEPAPSRGADRLWKRSSSGTGCAGDASPEPAVRPASHAKHGTKEVLVKFGKQTEVAELFQNVWVWNGSEMYRSSQRFSKTTFVLCSNSALCRSDHGFLL